MCSMCTTHPRLWISLWITLSYRQRNWPGSPASPSGRTTRSVTPHEVPHETRREAMHGEEPKVHRLPDRRWPSSTASVCQRHRRRDCPLASRGQAGHRGAACSAQGVAMKPLALWLLMHQLSATPSTRPPLTPCKSCFVLTNRAPAPTRPTPRRPHTGQTH